MNEITTKMAEQTQLQQVTMKDLKKVEAGKRLASSQYYGIGAIVAIGALGNLLLLLLIREKRHDPNSPIQGKRYDSSP